MKVSTLKTIFEEIYNKIDTNNILFHGICIWPLIKMSLNSKLINISTTIQVSAEDLVYRILIRSGEFFRGFYRFLLVKIKYTKNLDQFSPTSYLFFTFSAAKRINIDNYFYDVFCDPIIDELGEKKCKKIEISNDYDFRFPGFYKSIPIQPIITLYYFISFILLPFYKIPSSSKLQLRALNSLLNSKRLYNHIPNLIILKYHSIIILFLSKYFERILVKTQPKLVFIISYYGLVGMSLVLACKKMKIKAIEIQHGYIGELHPAYSFWSKSPDFGYDLIPLSFGVWSESEKVQIYKWLSKCKSETNVFIVGNLMIEKFKKNNSPIVSKIDKIVQSEIKDKNLINVLVSLQWDRYLPKLYKELFTSDNPNIRWWIRLHPSTPESERKYIDSFLTSLQSNFEVRLANSLPLYGLLRNVDVHLTELSTVVIEAEEFGLKSIITDQLGTEYFTKQILNGNAFYENDSAKIIELIYSIKKENSSKSRVYMSSDTESIESIINNLV